MIIGLAKKISTSSGKVSFATPLDWLKAKGEKVALIEEGGPSSLEGPPIFY